MNKPPTISIVILTKNRPQLLEKALTSIHRQTVKPIEVIIVDGSTRLHRETIAVIKKHSKTLHIIKRNTKRSIPYSRMLGAKTAHGELIVYLDDDCAADPSYLSTFRHHFQKQPALTAVIGRITNAHRTNIYASAQFAYYQRGLSHFFPSQLTHEPMKFGRILDCEVMGIRKKTLLEFGFPERHRRYRNDDIELGLRLVEAGKSIIFDPRITATASPRTALIPLWIAAFWNGHSDACTSDIYQANLGESPHPTFFPAWFIREVRSQTGFSPLKKIGYTAVLLSFPVISRIGMLWYHLAKRV